MSLKLILITLALFALTNNLDASLSTLNTQGDEF